jgi:hypothetical protein
MSCYESSYKFMHQKDPGILWAASLRNCGKPDMLLILSTDYLFQTVCDAGQHVSEIVRPTVLHVFGCQTIITNVKE